MPRLLDVFHTGEFWRGSLFPVGRVGSPIKIGEDIEEVFSSILQILNTRPGERVMYPEFGSKLGPLLWEPHDAFLKQDITNEIIKSLSLWEPRVEIISIAFDDNPRLVNLGILIISLELRLKNNPRLRQTFRVPISSQGSLFRSN